MDQNMVAANGPFITTQGDHVVETNYMTNGIVFQIRGDLNNDEEKKYSRRPLRMKTLVFIILPINGLLKRNRQEGKTSIQLHSFDDLDSTEDIPPPEYKRHKGRVGLKSSIEGNKLYQTN
ncbi:uncharacterized protein OCT59_025914 [Rhizophagus irregularis]|uniref:uncharacterized protein n=1 Tax=Rhizophagus irregularis TaxID=588596 RepID=UPI0033168846|nr:hypothetical protein OCT59_025914 [Rhizophagus irregularis]